MRRKCETSLTAKKSSPRYTNFVGQLHQQTLESFLEADAFFRRIEVTAPTLYVRLVRLIDEYEKYVVETAATWTGTPEALTNQVRDGLEGRVTQDLAPEFD